MTRFQIKYATSIQRALKSFSARSLALLRAVVCQNCVSPLSPIAIALSRFAIKRRRVIDVILTFVHACSRETALTSSKFKASSFYLYVTGAAPAQLLEAKGFPLVKGIYRMYFCTERENSCFAREVVTLVLVYPPVPTSILLSNSSATTFPRT